MRFVPESPSIPAFLFLSLFLPLPAAALAAHRCCLIALLLFTVDLRANRGALYLLGR